MPPKAASYAAKTSSVASVPSYAELLSSSRAKAKAGGGKVQKAAAEAQAPTTVPYADPGVAATASRVAVGCRVVLSSSGLFGTVRFAGNTFFQAGLWVGVELDSLEGGHKPKVVRGMLSRGKNDGTVKGQRYFTCPENHGIFVRPTSFDVISYPGGGGERAAGETTAGSVRSAARVKSVSDSDESSTDAFKPTTYASSVASSAASHAAQSQSIDASESATLSYGALFGSTSADSEPASSPGRHSASSPRAATAPQVPIAQQARRLSPRRRTSALVSSIDDVLASMEYAASDLHRASKEKKDASAFKAAPARKDSKAALRNSLPRPKSPFERRTQSSSVAASSEEERLFVENLVELVAKSPVVSDYLKTEIEKHHKAQLGDGLGEGSSTARADVADLVLRVHELETAAATAFARQAAAADRAAAALAARVGALEHALVAPLHALTSKLADLEKLLLARPGLGGAPPCDLRQALDAVQALAVQAHGALQAAD